MTLFRSINLAWKFTIFAGLSTVFLLIAMMVSYRGMRGTNERFELYADKYQTLGSTVGEMLAQGLQTEQAIRNVILNPADEKAFANYKKASEEFLKLHKEATATAAGIKDYAKRLDKLPPLWQEGETIKDEVIRLARDGKQSEAIELLVQKETPKWRQIKDRIIETQNDIKKDMKAERASLDAFTVKTFTMTVATLVLTIVLVNVLLLVFWRVMQSSFNELIDRLRDIASGEGDLSKRVEIKGKDEMAQAAHWLNQFMDKLSHTISGVAGTTSTLASATFELNGTAEQMAVSTEEVAAQASTVATASEEMAATGLDIANNCHMAAQSATRAVETTQRGFDVVRKTVDGIRDRGARTKENAQAVASLGDRSDQIGAIVSTIEDIADQTNLLALNAAIEAARAGEQGRGFAVVADEVRALAERTTRATKEIGDMIRSIQQETRNAIVSMEEGVIGTEKGAQEAAQLEVSLQEILEQVNAVTMQISQIATAAEEQTATTNEITSNIHKISEVIMDASRGSQDTAAASSSLSRLGEDLRSLVGQFKLA
ncbi:methyl-accepting chemotaxis protein [Geobacter sp. AOG2]|uniref:methyl-accepting chemotaxis protein n=1 Tax=Geobacter sp. AOG2 TaxID=1566347 RepID=UPI001CC4E476|nr:methyl-accepting chemotaxis protein [Geobacter sp. AOG2]GFE61724.1 methyl-accepting chemotaxis protein [Geobacter sp. AOG2]